MVLDVGDVLSIVLLLVLVGGPLAWAVRHYGVVEDLRTARRVFRIDGVALAVGAALLAASVALLALAWTPEAPVVMLLSVTLLGLGTLGIVVAVANRDWYLASRRLPVSTPDDVEPGPVQLEGRAVPLEELVSASVTDTGSLAYRAVTREERAVLGRGYAGSTWSAVSVADDAAPFGVVSAAALGDAAAEGRELPATLRAELDGPDVELPEDAETVAVDGPAAAFPLLSPTSRLVKGSPASDTLDGLERTIPAEPGTTVPVADDLDRGTRPRPREYSERRLDPGDPVYVLGTAREVEGGDGTVADGNLEIVDDPDGPPLIVARISAAEATAHATRFTRTYGLLGLASFATGATILLSLAF